MSELKEHLFVPYSELQEGDELTDAITIAKSYYLKSEADEVISTIRAERDEYRYNLSCARNEIHNMQALMRDDIKTIANLKADYKEACDRLQTANLIKDEQLAATRHHKYKRCAAMTMWCESKSEIYNEFAADASEYMPSYKARFRSKAVLYQKWAMRWLELAEKFKDKEAK